MNSNSRRGTPPLFAPRAHGRAAKLHCDVSTTVAKCARPLHNEHVSWGSSERLEKYQEAHPARVALQLSCALSTDISVGRRGW